MNRLPFHDDSNNNNNNNNGNNSGNRHGRTTWTKMTDEELNSARERAEREGIDEREHAWLRRAHLTGATTDGTLRDLSKAHPSPSREDEEAEDQGRILWGNNDNDPYDPVASLASNVEYYDKWQQAYRFLGGFIDCDRQVGGGSHDNNQGGGQHCSRWMMWAANYFIQELIALGNYITSDNKGNARES